MTEMASIMEATIVYTVIITLVAWVIGSIGKMMIFPKAGIEGWKGFIPFYSEYLLYKMSWIGSIYLITLILTVVGSVLTYNGSSLGSICSLAQFVINAVMYWNLSKKFGKGAGMAIGLIILPVIFLIVLGADKNAEYEDKSGCLKRQSS